MNNCCPKYIKVCSLCSDKKQRHGRSPPVDSSLATVAVGWKMVRLTELLTLQSRSRGDVRGQPQLYETHSGREMIEVRGRKKLTLKVGW